MTISYFHHRVPRQRQKRIGLGTLLLVMALNAPCSAHAENYTASFKNTDIQEFINTVSKNLNKTIVIDPGVKGAVTVRSYEKLDAKQYYQFFLSVLDVYGFAVVNMPNGVMKIIPAKNARGAAIPLMEGKTPAADDEVLMRVIPLHNVTGKELAPLLRQFNDTATGSVVHYDPSNVLLMTGRAAVIKQLASIVENIDRAGDTQTEVIHLQHALAGEVVKIVNSLYQENGKSASSSVINASAAADERTNSVVITGEKEANRRIAAMVAQLDRAGETRGNTHVIYLKYAKAENLLEVLTGISNDLQSGKDASSSSSTAISTLKDTIIKADKQTNALIINASPDLMRDLEQVIAQLDIRRAQVLVEAIIVEIQGAEGFNLGVQWFNQHGGGTNFPDSGTSVTGLSDKGLGEALKGVTGLTAGFYHGNWTGLFSALQSNSQSNILATPSIVTLDNMEAEFSVGQDVPILTGSQTTAADNIFNTVSRKDVGIKLKVKPQINKGDSVMLEIEQEVSSVADQAASNTSDLGATFNTRTVRNGVLVGNGNTVVIGGLLDTSNNNTDSSVPLLGRIPLIGKLFSASSNKATKRNLMLFIRPTIIREQESFDSASARKLDKFNQEEGNTPAVQHVKHSLNNELDAATSDPAFTTLLSDVNAYYHRQVK